MFKRATSTGRIERLLMSDGFEPIALAMIVCDNIHIDPSTGSRTLLGTISVVKCSTYPKVRPLICVYLVFTECYGPFEFAIRIVHPNEELPPIFEQKGMITAPLNAPLAVVDLDLRLSNVNFPSPGEYRFQFLCRDAVVCERRIMIVDPTARPPASGKQ